MVTFFDEVTAASNPLPPGILVSVYGGSVAPANLVGSGYLTLGGNLSITLQPAGNYIATFTGTQAPALDVAFMTDANGNATVNVTGYRSPTMSATGYAIEQTNRWPTSWYTAGASSPGGNAYPFAAGLGAILNAGDVLLQAALAEMRLPTSPGAEFQFPIAFDETGSYDSGVGVFDPQYASDAIDTWAADFFGAGSPFMRQPNMSDAQWVALIQTTLQTQKLTLVGIQKIITAWMPWILQQAGSPTPGIAIGADTFGGSDVNTYTDETGGTVSIANRNIIVFDTQAVATAAGLQTNNPTLAGYLSLAKGYVVVYFQNPNNPDSGIGTIASPSSLLTAITNAWKASGIIPVFAEN